MCISIPYERVHGIEILKDHSLTVLLMRLRYQDFEIKGLGARFWGVGAKFRDWEYGVRSIRVSRSLTGSL